MKIQILAFLALFFSVTSCNDDRSDPIEKAASYDVYLGGIDEFKACYWKNGQQTFVQGGENLKGTQIIVDNNDIYLLATNIETIDPVESLYFWKNGVKHNVAQYLNTAPNTASESDNLMVAQTMTINNGDIYFTGVVKNPAPTSSQDLYQHCYWKNGVKTVLESFGSTNQVLPGSLGIFNNEVYVASRRNFQYTPNPTWDLGYYKNNTYHVVTSSLLPHQFIQDPSNQSQFYLSTRNSFTPYSSQNIFSVKNITSGNDIQIPANIIQSGIRSMYFEDADKYYVGKDFYYKNNTLVPMNSPNGFNNIGYFAVKDHNIYTTRYNPTQKSVKFYINDVEAQSLLDISRSCFNSIFVVKNN